MLRRQGTKRITIIQDEKNQIQRRRSIHQQTYSSIFKRHKTRNGR